MNKENTSVVEPDQFQLSRRKFVFGMAGGLVVGFALPLVGGRNHGSAEAAVLMPEDNPLMGTAMNAWIRIGTNSMVELLFGGCEMGQGTMTGLAQLLAEELQIGWDQIEIRRPHTGELPTTTAFTYLLPANPPPATSAKATFWYGTGGSSGISRRWYPLRIAAAQARELLVAAAIQQAGGVRTDYTLLNGIITHVPSGRAWLYGDLAAAAALIDFNTLNIDPYALLTDPAVTPFKVIGQPLPRPDIPSKVNGSAQFGIDIWFKDMVFAVIRHCPTFGGVLSATPATPAGALAVIPCTASDNRGLVVQGSVNAVAVVADNTWQANKLAKALKVSWKLPASTATVNTASINLAAQNLLATPVGTWLAEPLASSDPNQVAAAESGFLAAMSSAVKTVDQTFQIPYLAHATMEVLNCTVRVTLTAGVPTACEIWAPTQNATATEATALTVLKTSNPALTTANIKIHTTFLGGGLGRKIEQDYISQAVQVALQYSLKTKKSVPVKLTWPREEDFAHDNYRPMGLVRVKAGLDSNNAIAGTFYRVVTPSISWQRATATNLNKTRLDGQAVEGAVKTGYQVGSSCVEWVPMDLNTAAVPVGYWRSVGASINTFAYESMIDMLAAAAGIDPLTFRINNMVDPRASAILTAVANSSWWQPYGRGVVQTGHAWGMAIAKAFGTTVCEVFEISKPALGNIIVHRVLCVVDCGTAVNPNAVEAQMQGGIIHGLNSALWGQMTFTNGVAQQTNFNKYRMLRLQEIPEITVEIMPSTSAPSGTGEPAVPPVAPALANAYARLTGTRITSLPFYPGAIMGGL